MLRRALQVGRQQLREEEAEELAIDLEEEGSEPELDPIRVQLAYLAYQQGKTKEASKTLLSVSVTEAAARLFTPSRRAIWLRCVAATTRRTESSGRGEVGL